MPVLRNVRRALFPIVERAFTYERFDRFLARLAAQPVDVVPLREFAQIPAEDRAVVALRHDVDVSLESALELGRLEHARGLRATYFVLHTARYWSSPRLLDALRTLQDGYRHEIGWHNDLVTVACVEGRGRDTRAYFAAELARLREAGISVVGSASHGSSDCYRYGYHNNYFFSDFAGELVPGFPNDSVVQTPLGRCEIPKASLEEFGLEYEAYHLDDDLYFSDTASTMGSRWHPDELDLALLMPRRKAIVLIHPCHWDRSVAAKAARLGRMVTARAGRAD